MILKLLFTLASIEAKNVLLSKDRKDIPDHQHMIVSPEEKMQDHQLLQQQHRPKHFREHSKEEAIQR